MKLILIDLDNTIISYSGEMNITPKLFSAVVSQMKDKGYHIGLASNSAHETLLSHAKKLGFNGPLIAERGAVIYFNNELIPTNEKATRWMYDFRYSGLFHFQKLYKGSTVIIGDATGFMKEPLQSAHFTEDILLINGLREHSFSLFAAKVDPNSHKLIPCADSLKHYCKLIEKLIGIHYHKSKTDLHWIEVPNDGLFIMNDISSSKSNGVSFLRDQIQLSEVHMIGDSLSDFIESGVTSHYAVSNASPEFKKHCDYVSANTLSSGVLDCLQYILKHN